MRLTIEGLKPLARRLIGNGSSQAAGQRRLAEVIALELSADGVFATKTQSRSTTEVVSATRSNWPESFDWQREPRLAGEWLREQLDTARMTCRDCVLVLPRRDVTLRLLQLPEIETEELVPLVRLQAESRLSQPIESLAIDFVPVPNSLDGQQDVVLLTALQSRITVLSEVAHAAGLRLVAAVAGDLAIPAAVGPDTAGLTLDVIVSNASTDLILSVAGCTVASMAIPVSNQPATVEQSARRIAASSDRLLASLPSSIGSSSVSLIRVHSETESDTLVRSLSEHTGQRVVSIQQAGSKLPTHLRATAAVASLSHSAFAHDFLHPRQPVNHTTAFRRRVVRWAVAASLLASCLGWWLYEENCAAADRIAALQEQERQLGELIERGQSVMATRAFVAEWQAGNIHWPTELAAFAEHLPKTDRAYLNRLQLAVDSSDGMPVIRASGVARDSGDVTHLTERLLAAESRYELVPHGVEPNLQDSFYQSAFQVEARLLKTEGTTSLNMPVGQQAGVAQKETGISSEIEG